MSRSRHYPGRRRGERLLKGGWHSPLVCKRERMRHLRWDLHDGLAEYEDCYVEDRLGRGSLNYRRAHWPVPGRIATVKQRRKLIYELCYRRWLGDTPDHWIYRNTFSTASKRSGPRFVAAHRDIWQNLLKLKVATE